MDRNMFKAEEGKGGIRNSKRCLYGENFNPRNDG